jgi:hypothetical protein
MMKRLTLILALLFAHIAAFSHGNSNIEGHFEIQLANRSDLGRFTLHLSALEAHALDGVTVRMRLGREFSNPFVDLEKTAEGDYTASISLVEGHYNMRVYLTGPNRDEIGVGGFTWVRGKAIAHSPETEVWFVPRGQYDPIPWADHISGVVIGFIALVLCFFILFRRKSTAVVKSKQHSNWILMVAAFAALMMPFGAYWDISAHAVSGREGFFQPPHLMIYGGILLCMALVAFAIGRKPRTLTWKAHLRTDKFAFGALVALMLQLSSGPFDELWHNMFGLDVSVWSPPHVILIFGGVAVCLYLSMLQVREATMTISVVRFLIVAGALLIVNVFLAEFEFPMPGWHISQQRPIWIFPLLMVLFTIIGGHAAQRSTHHKWAATMAIVTFVGLRLLASAFLIALGQSVLPALSWWLVLLPIIGVGLDFMNKNNRKNESTS